MIALLIGIYIILNLYNSEKNKAVLPEDIKIEATLKENESENMQDKGYILEVVIDQKKDSQNMIYPYLEGLGNMSFDRKEEEGYFIPSSIGTHGNDVAMIIKTLEENNIIEKNKGFTSSSFIGFGVPKSAGNYKLKMYFDEVDNFNASEKMYLIYVRA